MSDVKKRSRYFVKLTDEHKRKLDFLAVDRGATSTEEFGGRLLSEAIDRLWESFDPKRQGRSSNGEESEPPPKAKGKAARK